MGTEGLEGGGAKAPPTPAHPLRALLETLT